ncbi:MAG: hypothetical protein DME22_00980 [Verrucomicrobia bacterium]|nr:MAG: hypothetical protein DME22_00980 [Verrucomicrobiota bacterium]
MRIVQALLHCRAASPQAAATAHADGARVCDPQRVVDDENARGVTPGLPAECCGSQRRAPIHGSADGRRLRRVARAEANENRYGSCPGELPRIGTAHAAEQCADSPIGPTARKIGFTIAPVRLWCLANG